jgi:hypothetical protein
MRLYNGCPDSELKAIWDEEDRLLAKIKRLRPEARCTRHYPPDEGYQVHVRGKSIGPMRSSRMAALRGALEALNEHG